MTYKQTTQVPNFVFDALLPALSMAELKVLLVVIRQTLGWVDARTGQRKTRDRISQSQFQRKTGLSRRSMTNAIQSLHQKNIIGITDTKGNSLPFATDRKGKKYLYYSLLPSLEIARETCAKKAIRPAQKGVHNKTNHTKPSWTFSDKIGTLLQKYSSFSASV